MPRKRSNLSRHTHNYRKIRLARSLETAVEREARLATLRERYAETRRGERSTSRQSRLDTMRIQNASLRYLESIEAYEMESKREHHAESKHTVYVHCAEDIVANVYNYLQTEYEELKSSIGDSCDLSPLANILKRTASATGVSEDAVSAILENKKRAADCECDADVNRVKWTHDYEDGDVSRIKFEESSCEDPDEDRGDDKEQEGDHESTDDDSQQPTECEVEDEYEYKPLDPLQLLTYKADLQHSSNVGDVPSVSNTTHTEITTQPAVVVYPQSSTEVRRVKPSSSLVTIKTEPDDEHIHR